MDGAVEDVCPDCRGVLEDHCVGAKCPWKYCQRCKSFGVPGKVVTNAFSGNRVELWHRPMRAA